MAVAQWPNRGEEAKKVRNTIKCASQSCQSVEVVEKQAYLESGRIQSGCRWRRRLSARGLGCEGRALPEPKCGVNAEIRWEIRDQPEEITTQRDMQHATQAKGQQLLQANCWEVAGQRFRRR